MSRQQSHRNFENRQLTGGRGGRGFYQQPDDNSGVDEQMQQISPPVIFGVGRVRGFSSSTSSAGHPSNVSSFCGREGGFSGHAFRGARGYQPVSSPQQYDSSPGPLQTRHLIVNGKDCTVFCDDNQYQVFCETLNIPFSLESPKKEVIWFTPEQLMVKAREHLDAGDIQQAGGKVWLAFMATTNMVFLNAGVWLVSHPALNSLSCFAICVCKKFYLLDAWGQGEM
uniref:Uncharacterized protein n=1 Tax=Meloidogyne incognita TaxID=6306 RepID=A0A914MWQ6_MELIC